MTTSTIFSSLFRVTYVVGKKLHLNKLDVPKCDSLTLPPRFRLPVLIDVMNVFRPSVPPDHLAEFVALFDGYERFYFEDCAEHETNEGIMVAAKK